MPPDDERDAPTGWVTARTLEEAQGILQNSALQVMRMSLDHDLGVCAACVQARSPCNHTGYAFVWWCAENGIWSVCKPTVHSMNPVGRAAMIQVITRYWQTP